MPLIRKNEGGWKPQRQWANADPDECRAWVQDPNVYWSGLAVVTTGLVVIDVDIKNGGRAEDLPDIANLEHAPQIITPSGGRHYYFTLPPGPDAHSRIGWRPGVDLKAGCRSLVYIPPTPGYVGTFPSRDIMPLAPHQLVLASLARSVSFATPHDPDVWREIWRGATGFSTSGCTDMVERRCVEIREAPAGAQRKVLIRVGLRTGSAVAKGGLNIRTAWPKLRSAALRMTNYDPRWPWTEEEIEHVLQWAVCQGWANEGGWHGTAPRARNKTNTRRACLTTPARPAKT